MSEGYKFPTEVIDLPSEGKLYPEDSPLASGKLEIKYITAKEERERIIKEEQAKIKAYGEKINKDSRNKRWKIRYVRRA